MSTEEKIKVDIYNGVYLDKEANFFVVELGEVEHKFTGEIKNAVKVIGNNNEGEEIEAIVHMDENDHMLIPTVKMIYHSEYLGELG